MNEPSETPNPQACYWRGKLKAQLAFLESCDYAPHHRLAAQDWYKNDRLWRPVTEENYDYALNAVPPLTMRRGFIAGEAYCHTPAGRGIYSCFRYFNGIPHMMLATVEEFFHGEFPLAPNEKVP